jgi:hypothetical protein
MAGTLLLQRCNPYGAETGGPRHIYGGLYGPNSARTNDDSLPENIQQGEWPCERPAEVRVYMECRCGHRGTIMALCSWHDETVTRSDPLNFGRTIRETVRARGHYEEIQRRQSGACMRCLFPRKAAEDFKAIEAIQTELYFLHAAGRFYTPRGQQLRAKIEALREELDRQNMTGEIHRCPMRLIQVS